MYYLLASFQSLPSLSSGFDIVNCFIHLETLSSIGFWNTIHFMVPPIYPAILFKLMVLTPVCSLWNVDYLSSSHLCLVLYTLLGDSISFIIMVLITMHAINYQTYMSSLDFSLSLFLFLFYLYIYFTIFIIFLLDCTSFKNNRQNNSIS